MIFYPLLVHLNLLVHKSEKCAPMYWSFGLDANQAPPLCRHLEITVKFWYSQHNKYLSCYLKESMREGGGLPPIWKKFTEKLFFFGRASLTFSITNSCLYYYQLLLCNVWMNYLFIIAIQENNNSGTESYSNNSGTESKILYQGTLRIIIIIIYIKVYN